MRKFVIAISYLLSLLAINATLMAEEGSNTTDLMRDVDGDGIEDTLKLEISSGSGASSTFATLTLSKNGKVISALTNTSFYSIINYHKVPEELLAPGMEEARLFLEETLFPNIRETPESSLLTLLNGHQSADWQDGLPSLPDNYAFLIQDLDQFSQSNPLSPQQQEILEALKQDWGLSGAVWLEYLGANHRFYDKVARPDPNLTRDFDKRENLFLLGTKHGVILYDQDKDQHKWIYVHPGVSKLRHQSIAKAEFSAEQTIRITLDCGPDTFCVGAVVEIPIEDIL